MNLLCFIFYRYQRMNDNLINGLIYKIRKYNDDIVSFAKNKVAPIIQKIKRTSRK